MASKGGQVTGKILSFIGSFMLGWVILEYGREMERRKAQQERAHWRRMDFEWGDATGMHKATGWLDSPVDYVPGVDASANVYDPHHMYSSVTTIYTPKKDMDA